MVLAPTVQVRVDLRALVARRTIDVVAINGAEPTLALDLQLNQPLPLSVAGRLDEETAAAAKAGIPGIVTPRNVHISGDRIRFELDPLQEGTRRLETIAGALAYAGVPFGPGAAASLVLTVASLISQLHDAHGSRSHGEIHQGVVLVSAGGAVAVLGSGHPTLQALLLPPVASTLDIRIAPEFRNNALATPAVDVYALGALYAQLLCGSAPAKAVGSRSTDHLAGLPPLPDPRPALVRLIESCLNPDPSRRPRDVAEFSGLLRQDLQSAGVALAGPGDLDRLLDTYVPRKLPSGNVALVSSTMAPEALRGYLTGEVPRLAGEITTANTGPILGGSVEAVDTPWDEVLEEEGLVRVNPPSNPGAAAVEDSAALRAVATPEGAPAVAKPSVDDLTLPPNDANKLGPSLVLPPPSDTDSRGSDWPAPIWPPAPASEPDRPKRTKKTKRKSSAERSRTSTRSSSSQRKRRSAHKRAEPTTAAPPSFKKIVLATVGALAIGFGIMSLQILTRPEPIEGLSSDESTDRLQGTQENRSSSPSTPDRSGSAMPNGPAASAAVFIPTARKAAEPEDEAEIEQAVLLSVVSQPMGADVTLDGEFLGATPIVLRRSLTPTDYILRITKDGFVPWQKVVRPGGNGALNISIVLEREAGR